MLFPHAIPDQDIYNLHFYRLLYVAHHIQISCQEESCQTNKQHQCLRWKRFYLLSSHWLKFSPPSFSAGSSFVTIGNLCPSYCVLGFSHSLTQFVPDTVCQPHNVSYINRLLHAIYHKLCFSHNDYTVEDRIGS